jgi:hypothetical protein
MQQRQCHVYELRRRSRYSADFGIGAGKENPFTITFKAVLDIIDVAEDSYEMALPSRLLAV